MISRDKVILGLRVLVHGATLALLAGLAWAFWQNQLGPDPTGELIRRTGRYAIVWLILSLVPTVIATVSGLKAVLRVRRALGLYAFLFSALHLLAFAGLDYAFNLTQIAGAIREGWRVLVGIAALLLLLPLAVTSTNAWVWRLGKNWKRLHRLAYLAAGLAVLHYALNYKELRLAPVLVGIVLAVLLVARIPLVARWLGQWAGGVITPPR